MSKKSCDCNFGIFWMMMIVIALVQSCGSVDKEELNALKEDVKQLKTQMQADVKQLKKEKVRVVTVAPVREVKPNVREMKPHEEKNHDVKVEPGFKSGFDEF